MAVEHVEVDEVAEHEAAVERLRLFNDAFHAVDVAFGVNRFGHTTAGKDVFDLADSDDGNSGCFQTVESRLARRKHRVVAAVVRALIRAFFADEGSSDHATQAVLIQLVASDLADLVQTFEAEVLFVRSNLEHRVGARVNDRSPGANVFGAEPLEHFRTRSGRVAQNSIEPGLLQEGGDDLVREAVGEYGEALGQGTAHHLPVPGRSVFARRGFRHSTKGGRRRAFPR